jgi:glycosyltransferase involved in cell wall biosynthesis
MSRRPSSFLKRAVASVLRAHHMESGMLGSIIICTYNRADILRETLASLASLEVPADLPCELIIVDNDSTDHTQSVVRSSNQFSMPVRYIREQRSGQSHARNTGMRSANGSIILFTDDDVRPPHDWIGQMCGPILAGTADAVAGGVAMAPHLKRPWMSRLHREWLASTEDFSANDRIEMVGANMAFSRGVLESVSGFDVELGPGALGYGDDTLFSLQLRAAGFRVLPAWDVKVEHHFQVSRLSRSAFFEAAKKRGRTAAYLQHHWEHGEFACPYRAIGRLVHHLAYSRQIGTDRETRMPVSPAELELVRLAYGKQYYLSERRRPRAYVRRGLRKLASDRVRAMARN